MLSPQIYIAKFDKTLTFNALDHTSHKVSSLVIASTKSKEQKGQKRGKMKGKRTAGERGRKEQKCGQKSVREMAVVRPKKDNFCNMQS